MYGLLLANHGRYTLTYVWQSFPLCKRVRVKPATVVELLDEDVVPIHHQRFPLTTVAAGFGNTGDANAAATDSPCPAQDACLTFEGSITPERHGDLYIHRYNGNRKIQIWVRDGNRWIGDVTDGHHHPRLPDYRLYVTDGIGPTWFIRLENLVSFPQTVRQRFLLLSPSLPSMRLECATLKITVKRQYGNIAADSSERLSNTNGGYTSLLTQVESSHQVLIDGNPEYSLLPWLSQLFDHDVLVPLEEFLAAGRDKVYPSKSTQPKFRSYDILVAAVLMFLFVLAGLDIWSYFVAVHGA
ncbi:hypothetical protein EDD15DRAFT_2192759 [Pisolithus albus]|nr:hypothetical protein EDD15DRAFT_2192759 [Pisolithus albus]